MRALAERAVAGFAEPASPVVPTAAAAAPAARPSCAAHAVMVIAALMCAAASIGRADAAHAELPKTGRTVLFADLDGDGRADPVVVYGDGGRCRLARVLRDGETLRTESITVDGDPAIRVPLLGDVTGDGLADLVAFEEAGWTLRRGLKSGSFDGPPELVAAGEDVLLPEDDCAAEAFSLMDVTDDRASEWLLPILGGVRVVRMSAGPATAQSRVATIDLTVEPRAIASGSSLSFASALPGFFDSAGARVLALGPVIGVVGSGGGSRLDMAWWTRSAADGSLERHRSIFQLPAGRTPLMKHVFDLDGDGSPELVVLAAPSRLESFLGEYELHVFRASDRTDRVEPPFFSAKTNLNFWQVPSIAFRSRPGGGDILLAFYRGLASARLNVEIFRTDGKRSFAPSTRDFQVGKEEEADREYLRWIDADGDGLLDLAASNGEELIVYRGLSDEERPVAREPAWRAAIHPGPGGIDLSMSSSGGWSIAAGEPDRLWFRDLDGDGLVEVVKLGEVSIDATKGGPASVEPEKKTFSHRVVIESLHPPAK